MFSALRSRGESAAPSTRRRFAEADDASASSSAILDTDEQEKVVQSLERQASNAAKTWRVAFGVAASLGSLFFALQNLSTNWGGSYLDDPSLTAASESRRSGSRPPRAAAAL